MKRRHFFQLIAGAAMIPVLPRLAKTAPMIWADGVHCDSAGVQAMLSGLPVEFADPALAAKIKWTGDVLSFGRVQVRLKETLKLPECFSGKTLRDGHFLYNSDMDVVLDCSGVRGATICHNVFDFSGAPKPVENVFAGPVIFGDHGWHE